MESRSAFCGLIEYFKIKLMFCCFFSFCLLLVDLKPVSMVEFEYTNDNFMNQIHISKPQPAAINKSEANSKFRLIFFLFLIKFMTS